eukprot:609494-Rhodomonas_salina.3
MAAKARKLAQSLNPVSRLCGYRASHSERVGFECGRAGAALTERAVLAGPTPELRAGPGRAGVCEARDGHAAPPRPPPAACEVHPPRPCSAS